ncbi:hypothetical protein PL321_12660 [Caloramator sp. mosi_1]|uniref:hypothetical protein n=1 Tax=Caloramator sp. mosi_1 TaxID=3023090 RepID=UPI0023609310|nr:hypothetical protein [Caloramator sp. mosi_1]WDC83542.1 hypothetical protein PL321_12660 [Caloramator sp. mosi_1]
MSVDIKERVRLACEIYYYAIKNEDKIPKELINMAKIICNDTIKAAKMMKVGLDNDELADKILK